MSKTELLEECIKLSPEDRAEILEALWAMENDAHTGPTPEEADLLDVAMEEYHRDGDKGRPFESLQNLERKREVFHNDSCTGRKRFGAGTTLVRQAWSWAG